MKHRLVLIAAALALGACAGGSSLPISQTFGPDPQLPDPKAQTLPTVKIADASGWPAGAAPTAADGLKVTAFARNLKHPRWLYVLPNGDVLAAETDGPPRPGDAKGIRGFFQNIIMKNAGSNSPSANRLTLLRDADGDGVAETAAPFLTGLNSPFGMALVGDTLYVADTDAIRAFPYRAGASSITDKGRVLTDLPGGDINHHWTKNILPTPDGAALFATVGSNSNVGENGLAAEENRAAILKVDLATGQKRIYASGLRNPNGLAYEPASGALWTAVNERDEIGNDLVPDYITSVREGAFYGWPFSYYGQHVDVRAKPQNPDLVAKAIKPDYAMGAHTASLGLTFAGEQGPRLGGRFAEGAFVGQHGSWNRDPPSGYQVIFVPFSGGRPSGPPLPVLTGFLANGKALGRPVGVVGAKDGSLLVADDVGGVIWRVSGAGTLGAPASAAATPK